METIAEFLARHPFTAGMRPEHLELMAGCARNVVLQPGSYVFHEGDPADCFYLLREGKVALEVFSPLAGALVVETLHDGDVLGWSWLFPPYRIAFDARVVEQTRAVSFDGACLRRKSEEDHELGYQLLHRLARVFTDRLSRTRMQLMDVYGQRQPE